MYGKMKDFLTKELADIREAGLYKEERIITTPQRADIEVKPEAEVLNFCANNYLGLSNNEQLIEGAVNAMKQRGYGMSSVRFICGTQDIHKQLEAAISDYFQTEDTILYSSCFDANGGLFEPLLGEGDAIISDALNHASIIDGVRLCKAKRYRYANANMEELEKCLQEAQAQRFRIIATDGVFSMDGYVDMKKKILQTVLFLGIMFLTFYTLLHGQNLSEIYQAVKNMSVPYLIAAAGLALFFVCAEGSMIWYLLTSMRKKTDSQTTVLCVVGKEKVCSLWRCIQYSFIGFFYSGITPSATGGQPVQLYYMNKDGNKGSDSTIVLMTVAVIYKIVLVVLGVGMLLFCGGALKTELQSFFPLYLLGLALNTVVVAVVLAAMLFPQWMIVVWAWVEKQFIRLDIWKANPQRMDKVQTFTGNYRNAVDWLKQHPGKLIVVIAVTFLQRCSVFLLTYMVYLGLGQAGTSIQEVVLLQASVYIAVDMLPLPGAQGITELMYRSVFAPVFSKGSLIPSMLISRGLNFYFLLLAGAGVTAANHFLVKKKI